jgi:hypothetical protein
VGVLGRHRTDESPNLFAYFRPAAVGPRSPSPVQAEARPMPSDHGIGFTMTRTSAHRGQCSAE